MHHSHTQIGSGNFQLRVLLICGLANAADAVEIMSVGLLGTGAEKDLGLTPERMGILNACIFLGMLLGGLIWGILGDRIGERLHDYVIWSYMLHGLHHAM